VLGRFHSDSNNAGNSFLVQGKIKQMLASIQSGDYRALARGITIVENELEGYEALMSGLEHRNLPKVIGITGPPGAGKSTLVNALLHYWLQAGKKIAVVAVDPSSPFNYGALLGDRIRMSEFYDHPSIFIRSLASRGALGGLNAKIVEITELVKNSVFDYVLVETVGVGQSEVEVAGLADCTIVALVPEAGDEVQTLKAGIMEIANVFVVNKADRDNAESLFRNLKAMVHEKANDVYEIPVVKTIASDKKGIEELVAAIENYLAIHQSLSEKSLQLMTEKAWQLIVAHKMKNISKTELKESIRQSLTTSNFNLYGFVHQLLT
jgi:LAO/AO transport system kinase